MQIFNTFEPVFNGLPWPWTHQLLQGVLLILFGIAILVFPQLLVAMIASVFFLAGATVIGSALALRRLRGSYGFYRPWFF